MGLCALRKDSGTICRVKMELPCCAGMLKQIRKEISSLLEHFGIVDDVIKKGATGRLRGIHQRDSPCL